MSEAENNISKDDEELVVVETQQEDEENKEDTSDEADSEDTEDADDDSDDDSDDDEDSRLADDDEEVDRTEANRRRRKKRREVQKRAKEAAQRELSMLRQQNADLLRRISGVEGYVANSNAQTLENQLAQVQQEIRQAEHIIAKATEAGNGQDVVAAMRIRDEALTRSQQLQTAKNQYEAAKSKPAAPDPTVVNYAAEWMKANPWYDPTGRDRDSALTKQIDSALAAEGYDPRTREYWEELTDRVADAFGETAEEKPAAPKKRKAPPTGRTREHAPVSTKKEVYVTPERKQAMIEAGVWDDAELRQRYLKAYQAYDNGSAR